MALGLRWVLSTLPEQHVGASTSKTLFQQIANGFLILYTCGKCTEMPFLKIDNNLIINHVTFFVVFIYFIYVCFSHSYLDKVSLENAVRYLNPNGNTAPFASNMAAVEHILQSFKNGNRPNVTDVIILLTEAHTENDWVFQAVTGHSRDVAINQLHQRSHNVIAIAAGGADTSLVRRIATDSDHFYHIIDFPDWRSQHIDNKIIKLICL